MSKKKKKKKKAKRKKIDYFRFIDMLNNKQTCETGEFK